MDILKRMEEMLKKKIQKRSNLSLSKKLINKKNSNSLVLHVHLTNTELNLKSIKPLDYISQLHIVSI